MLTDGRLMRLPKADFNALLKEPLQQLMTYDDAAAATQTGQALWLDVRLPSEFEAFRLPGAINVPLYFLRLKLSQLSTTQHYIVVCDTGRRSSAAAFILTERGFSASILEGGLTRVQALLGD